MAATPDVQQVLRDMDKVIAEATQQGVQLHRLRCSSSLAASATLTPAHGSPRTTRHVEAVAELSERVVSLTKELAEQRSARNAAQARTSTLKRHLADAQAGERRCSAAQEKAEKEARELREALTKSEAALAKRDKQLETLKRRVSAAAFRRNGGNDERFMHAKLQETRTKLQDVQARYDALLAKVNQSTGRRSTRRMRGARRCS